MAEEQTGTPRIIMDKGVTIELIRSVSFSDDGKPRDVRGIPIGVTTGSYKGDLAVKYTPLRPGGNARWRRKIMRQVAGLFGGDCRMEPR